MKEKRRFVLFCPWYGIKQGGIRMCRMFLLCLLIPMHMHAVGFGQQTKVTLTNNRLTVEQIFDVIAKQLKYDVFYSENELNVKKEFEFNTKTMELSQLLEIILEGRFKYDLDGQIIIIRPAKAEIPQGQAVEITGVVKDQAGVVVPGVTVLVKGTSLGTATDKDGKFTIRIAESDNIVLVFSFLGMKQQEIVYRGQQELKIVMEEETTKVDEVIVTGYYERRAETFTGSASTFTAEDLKMVGNQNVFQALRTLDPSFVIRENNMYGSDPNRMPDIEIRGKSSVVGVRNQYETDPNQPLFILDGFQVPAQTFYDLNMDRIASINILKDAAAAALYGSQSANGVIVIETKRPAAGKLKLTYSGRLAIDNPDLSGYNLMNAEEKLEFERMAGMYKLPASYGGASPEVQVILDRAYNTRLYNVKSGVNTDWLSEPVRTGLTHSHNLNLEGGDNIIRYNLGGAVSFMDGVMKQSNRESINGYLRLIYRTEKINFNNQFTIDFVKAENPTIGFKVFAEANPYFPKHDSDGNVPKNLVWESLGSRWDTMGNPLYDASLGNLKQEKETSFKYNTQLDYQLLPTLKLTARFSIRNREKVKEEFKSPFLSKYTDTDVLYRGEYTRDNENGLRYEGDLMVNYGLTFREKHILYAFGGWSFSSERTTGDGYIAIGFPNDEVKNPAFSSTYKENTKPSFSEKETRKTGFYGTVNYSYDQRYLLDASLRLDGSSVFGSNKRFTEIWAVGLAWNMHNENFMAGNEWLNRLKIRGSVGNPGNSNFASYQTYTTYAFSSTLKNQFGLGSLIRAVGNPDLLWQKTTKWELGFDANLFKNRLSVIVNLYKNITDPLLVKMAVPTSTGRASYMTNFGKQDLKGWEGIFSYVVMENKTNNTFLRVNMHLTQKKSSFSGIGNKLDGMNEEIRVNSDEMYRYHDGGSPDDIWAVRSAGIDPATGQEIFVKKDGTYTFQHDFSDEVKVGNTQPKMEGVFGFNLNIKGFTASAQMRFKYKGDIYNSALYEKIEKITEGNYLKNQDKRAFYNRWKQAGDKAQFKGITILKSEVNSFRTSRFVQEENVLSGESFSLGYNFMGHKWLNKIGLSELRCNAYMNDIFRLSSVKAERGIDYPFKRTVTFSINATF